MVKAKPGFHRINAYEHVLEHVVGADLSLHSVIVKTPLSGASG